MILPERPEGCSAQNHPDTLSPQNNPDPVSTFSRRLVLLAPGVILFLLVVIVPAALLMIRAFQLGRSDAAAGAIDTRQWMLFGRSVGLAAGGALAGVALGIPGAFVVGRMGRLTRAPALAAVLLAPLLLPPMVYAFGWQRVGLPSIPPVACCIGVWASWCWPIPAMLIGTGWARSGRGAFQAALLVTTPAGAFGRVVLPLLVRQASVAALILFLLLLVEYSVPHACNLVVLATELLGWAAQSDRPADALVPAVPLITVTAVGLATLVWAWRRSEAVDEADTDDPPRGSAVVAWVVLLAIVGLTVVLPVGGLAVRFQAWRLVPEAVTTYGTELWRSIAVAVAGGVVAVVMGVSLAASDRLRRWALPAALLFGVLPAALTAEAILVTYQPVRIVYQYWPLLVIGYVARYGWIGLSAAWLAYDSTPRDLVGQARVDGADETAIVLRLRYGPNLALLWCAAGVVAAMSLADVAVGTMLTVPGIGPISSILLEKFHRLEDGMLVALGLWLVIGAVPAAVLAWVALRVWMKRVS